MAQRCAGCPTMIDEDDQALVTEGGDVLCEPDGVGCGSTFKAYFPDEVAYIRQLKDVHPRLAGVEISGSVVQLGVRVPPPARPDNTVRQDKERVMPEISDQIQNLLDSVPESKGSGKYLDQLSDGGREVLDEFETWLKEEDGKTESTARAYKGYCAKAIVELTKNPDYELDTDVKSAINALRRFQTAVQAMNDEAPREPVGDDLT